MAGIYGEARAEGDRTAESPCYLGIGCGAIDRDAWWAAGVHWSKFLRNMLALLAAKDHPELDVELYQALEAVKAFDGEPPVFTSRADLEKWAQQQQQLRDAAGVIAAKLQAPPPPPPPPPPVKDPDPVPPPAPPASSSGGGWIAAGGLAALLTVGGIAIARRRKARG